ncbi:MAG: TIGR00341 family protein [Cyanobacteria bacterium P01_E01_bin.35]
MIDRERLSKLIWLKLRRKSRKLIPKQEKEVAIKRLHRELWLDATWNTNYIVFTISACMIATFGLISNSTAVIIGAMLVAPLMLPLRALAFAALDGDYSLFRKALLSIIGATIVALLLSSITGHIINIPEFGSETLARTQPTLVDLGIAVVAGGISSFAKVRKGVSDAIAGTAIAVALMPPLCVVGLSLSQSKFYFARGAFLLYLTNLLGITLACMIVFVLAGYTQVSHALGWTFALTSLMLIPLGARVGAHLH